MAITYKTPTDGTAESISEPLASGPQGGARLASKALPKKPRGNSNIHSVSTLWSTKLALRNGDLDEGATESVKPKPMTNGFTNHR